MGQAGARFDLVSPESFSLPRYDYSSGHIVEALWHPGVRVLPVNGTLAIDATSLPEWIRKPDKKPHEDPGDKFIVAEARRRNAVLITSDTLMIDYARKGHVIVFDARV